MADNKQDKVRIKYVFDKDYNPICANGAFGGVGARGDIILNFFYERPPLPKHMVQTVDDNGNITETLDVDPKDFDDLVIRYITSGVSLRYKDAVSIRDLLDRLIKMKEEEE